MNSICCRKFRLLIYLTFLFVLCFYKINVCFAEPTDLSFPIKSISIEGNQHIPSKEIRPKVQTKIGDIYSKYQIRNDIKKIYETGYFSEVAVDMTQEHDGIKITFLVKENPLVKDLIFEGNKTYKAKRLKNELKFSEDQVYQEDSLQGYIDRLKSFYKEKEFLVDIQGKIEPIDEEHINLAFTIQEERKAKILRILFSGNHAIRAKVLRKTLKSKHSWLFFSHYFDRSLYEDDVKRIERAYKDKGYVLVKVIAEEPQFIPSKRGAILHFSINEGLPYNVGTVDISGNRLFSTGEVQNIIKFKTGQIYNQTGMEKDIENLYNLYANEGYVLTNIDNQLSLDSVKHLVNISYQIHESNRVIVGDVRIKGISVGKETLVKTGKGYGEVPLKTKENVIRREITLDRGDILRKDEMERSKNRLINLGFFDGVYPSFEQTASADTLDLVLLLAERQTGTIQFGVGYSTEKKAEVFVDLQESNLFGSGRSVRVKADLAQEGSEYNLIFTDPYFMDTRLGVTLNLYRDVLSRTINATQISTGSSTTHDYNETQTGAAITVSYPIDQYLRATLQLEHKRVQLKPSDSDYSIPAPLGPTDSQTNSITPGITYDSRDNIFWPTHGVRYVATTQFAGGPLGADNDYIKLYAEANWYKRFSDKFISALRIRGGYLAPYGGTDDAPISDRFFLGGSNTLRGFNFRGVSPTVTYTDTTRNETVELVVGGDLMLNLNLELRRKITERLMGVFFFDAGGVWSKVEDFNPSEIRFSVGPGIVLDLPGFGYFQVGYGFPFNEQPGDDTQGPYFTFGSTF